MTPQELIDRTTALLTAEDYDGADALLAAHGWALWDRMTDAQRREVDGLAQLVQVGRDAIAASAPPTAGGVAVR
jgi:hypothetical protein